MSTLALPRNPLARGASPIDMFIRQGGPQATIAIRGYMAFKNGEPLSAAPKDSPEIWISGWKAAADFILRGKV